MDDYVELTVRIKTRQDYYDWHSIVAKHLQLTGPLPVIRAAKLADALSRLIADVLAETSQTLHRDAVQANIEPDPSPSIWLAIETQAYNPPLGGAISAPSYHLQAPIRLMYGAAIRDAALALVEENLHSVDLAIQKEARREEEEQEAARAAEYVAQLQAERAASTPNDP